MSPVADLARITQNRVRNLSGHERGLAARKAFDFDAFDGGNDIVEIIVPEELNAISPSFFQGMFSKSVKTLGLDQFKKRYRFQAKSDQLLQVERGIRAILRDRAAVQ